MFNINLMFQDVRRVMEPHQQWQYLQSLQILGGGGHIAEWGMLVLMNKHLRGAQKIRCQPKGMFSSRKQGGFHGKSGLQDCIFMIPPDTAESDSVHFDYARPQDRWQVVYGRVYCIFEIRVRYFEQRRREHRYKHTSL